MSLQLCIHWIDGICYGKSCKIRVADVSAGSRLPNRQRSDSATKVTSNHYRIAFCAGTNIEDDGHSVTSKENANKDEGNNTAVYVFAVYAGKISRLILPMLLVLRDADCSTLQV